MNSFKVVRTSQKWKCPQYCFWKEETLCLCQFFSGFCSFQSLHADISGPLVWGNHSHYPIYHSQVEENKIMWRVEKSPGGFKKSQKLQQQTTTPSMQLSPEGRKKNTQVRKSLGFASLKSEDVGTKSRVQVLNMSEFLVHSMTLWGPPSF